MSNESSGETGSKPMLRDSKLSRWFPIVLAVLGFSVISPALWSGWLGDDAFYSALNGVLKADGLSLWQAMLRAFQEWFLRHGRFYPGELVEKYFVFHIFTNLVAYKTFLVAMTLVTVELFRRCVTGYTNAATANLCALIVITLFTERGYHDSISCVQRDASSSDDSDVRFTNDVSPCSCRTQYCDADCLDRFLRDRSHNV